MSVENKKNADELLSTVKPIGSYRQIFTAHCNDPGERISTGLLDIDRMLNGGLSDELYIAAAETSTGKSSMMMAIAENIAKDGTDVLYFALEMSRNEFIARGVSSISFRHWVRDNSCRKFTAAEILYWDYDDRTHFFEKLPYQAYEAYVDEYFAAYGEHMHIIEGGTNGLTVKDIANIAAIWKAKTKRKPVVIVDYLQLIRPDPSDRAQADRKTKMDIAVTTLKTLASQIGMPVMTISSISRSKYRGKVDTSSFKESGDTEYTGGVLIGWNWLGVTDEKEEELIQAEKAACKQRGYRRMSFAILKNRNSARDTAAVLRYYPAYSYFCIEKDLEVQNKESKKQTKIF